MAPPFGRLISDRPRKREDPVSSAGFPLARE